MEIEVVKAKDLEEFFYSEKNQKQRNLPISSLRVQSLINFPNLDPDTEVLAVAYNNEDEIIAYKGVLPTIISDASNNKICFSSGWWKHPEKGNLAALKVFAKILQTWDNQLLFDDLPNHTKSILEKFDGFELIKTFGKKYYLKFDLQNWLVQKYPNLIFSKTLFIIVDRLANVFLKKRKSKKGIEELNFEKINRFDTSCKEFIEGLSGNSFLNRSANELNWILNNKWLSNETMKYKNENRKYFFSLLCQKFENHLYKVKLEGKLIGVVWLTERDGYFKLPYVFYEVEHTKKISLAIYTLLQKLGAKSFLTFQIHIIDEFETFSFLYDKIKDKTFGFPNALKERYQIRNKIQDGDGDFVFT